MIKKLALVALVTAAFGLIALAGRAVAGSLPPGCRWGAVCAPVTNPPVTPPRRALVR
jgi:hypothetical protein